MVSLIVEQDTNMPGILMELIGHINTERRSLLMKNIFKKHVLIIMVILFLLVDFAVLVVLTFSQTSYSHDFPKEEKIYNLFSDDSKNGTQYYMNGAGDIKGENVKLKQLLSTSAIKKGEFESYVLLFTLGKNDYVFSGMTVYTPTINRDERVHLKLYEKNNTVYAVALTEQETPSNKDVFSVYSVEDESFAKEILEYKAEDNKYYAYTVDWINYFTSFNTVGKILTFILILEFGVVVIFAREIYKKKTKGRG